MERYKAEIAIAYPAEDHSEATRVATELTSILRQAGYDHVSTTVLDEQGDVVADFA